MSPVVTTTEIGIRAVECGECGIVFGMTDTYYEKRLEDHRTWYCPNGHPRAYLGKSEAEKLQQRLTNERELRRETEQRLERERRAHRATKGKLTKTKNRVAAGVCPCCNRTFQNLGRHMQGQHPDYVEHP